jgi:hypothetical protein
MRGGAFHNRIAEEVKMIFSKHGWQIFMEHRYRNNGITTYLDLFAIKGDKKIACEVETTARHVIDNAIKAQSVGIGLWIIVPTRTLYRKIEQKLRSSALATTCQPIRILLLCQLKVYLIDFSEKNSF